MTASTPVTTDSLHHGLPVHEVVLLLETDPHQGLRGEQAEERLERFGPNTLPSAPGPSLLVRSCGSSTTR